MRSVTTREPRFDDAGHYDYLTATALEDERRAGLYFVVARYGEHNYAVRVQEVLRATAAGLSPILTLTPAAAIFLDSDDHLAWCGAYLDAPDAVLDARLATRGRAADPGIHAQRAVDRSIGAGIFPVVVNDRSLAEAVAAVGAAVGCQTAARNQSSTRPE